MARDIHDSDYYVSQGGKIPVKWTAPEVSHYIGPRFLLMAAYYLLISVFLELYMQICVSNKKNYTLLYHA